MLWLRHSFKCVFNAKLRKQFVCVWNFQGFDLPTLLKRLVSSTCNGFFWGHVSDGVGNTAYHEFPGRFCGESEGYLIFCRNMHCFLQYSACLSCVLLNFAANHPYMKIRAKYVQNACFARAKIRPVQGAWISVEGAWISVQKPVQNTYFSWFWTIPIFHGFVQKNMKNLWKSIKFLWNVVFSPGNRLSWQISAEDRGSTRQRPAKGWGLVL